MTELINRLLADFHGCFQTRPVDSALLQQHKTFRTIASWPLSTLPPEHDLAAVHAPGDGHQSVQGNARSAADRPALPAWNGDLDAAARGLSEEQRAEARKVGGRRTRGRCPCYLGTSLLERHRAIASRGRVEARSELNHIDDAPDGQPRRSGSLR